MEHKGVKKKWDTLVFVVCSQCKRVIEGLIDTTPFYCLSLKSYASKNDLKLESPDVWWFENPS